MQQQHTQTQEVRTTGPQHIHTTSRVLEQLGIFGWKEKDENLALASLLTGDPLLLIGNHGSAKTLIANKIAEALEKRFCVYDASKAMFEDVLGYPNVEKLKEGIVEYVPSKVTIWDKEIVLIDELNRAVPELQSKWLEIIRSRKIMGFTTQVKWVWSAMNPMTYSATQALDAALVGRFALFLYPPDVLEMSEEDRIRVTAHLNGEDGPALREWTGDTDNRTVTKEDVQETGKLLRRIFRLAARHFLRLQKDLQTLSEFLARFADLLMRESKGEIALDGRRLGFLYRNILANRAIESAKSDIFGTETGSFVESARQAVAASIPVGLSDESLKREEAVHKMEICFDLLSAYFEPGSEIARIHTVYELFTTRDLMRKVEILLQADLSEFAASKAWNDLVNGEENITLLAYTALQVEARRPGVIPGELLESLSRKIVPGCLNSESLPNLEDDAIEYIEEINALLEQDTDLARLIAFQRVWSLIDSRRMNSEEIEKTRKLILQDMETFENLIEKGGEDHVDVPVVA